MPLQDAIRWADADPAEAAEFLARTAMHALRHGPLVKRAEIDWQSVGSSPYAPWNWDLSRLTEPVRNNLPGSIDPSTRDLITRGLVGGGIGAAGMGAAGLLQGKKRRRLGNSMLAGLLTGAGVGAGLPKIKEWAGQLNQPIATKKDVENAFNAQNVASRIYGVQTGQPGSEGHTVTGEIGRSVKENIPILTSQAVDLARAGGQMAGGAVGNAAASAVTPPRDSSIPPILDPTDPRGAGVATALTLGGVGGYNAARRRGVSDFLRGSEQLKAPDLSVLSKDTSKFNPAQLLDHEQMARDARRARTEWNQIQKIKQDVSNARTGARPRVLGSGAYTPVERTMNPMTWFRRSEKNPAVAAQIEELKRLGRANRPEKLPWNERSHGKGIAAAAGLISLATWLNHLAHQAYPDSFLPNTVEPMSHEIADYGTGADRTGIMRPYGIVPY